MARWLRRNIRSYDIVHGHSVFLYPTTAAFRCARRQRVPYVVSPRGMLVRELIEAKSTRLKTGWIKLFERRNLYCAAAVHLTSDAEYRALDDMGLDFSNTSVLPNGVDSPAEYDVSRLSSDVARCIAQSGYILYFGRISWKKGIDELLRRFGDVQGARLVVAGNDDEDCSPRLRALATELGLSHRVEFIVRSIGGGDKAALFRHAGVFVLPSRSENFGNTVVEAMSYSLPVVVTPEVGAAEIVSEAGCGLVSPVGEFAASINRLLSDPGTAQRAGSAGQAWARNHLLWPAVAGTMATTLPVGYRPVCSRCIKHASLEGSRRGISVMIFTLNEELHLPVCLDSLQWCDDVIVVDSFSTDGTEQIARSRGARFFQHAFTGFGSSAIGRWTMWKPITAGY